MPIVEVTYNYCNGTYYNSGTIRVTDPNTAGYDSTYIAAYKYRGATAQNYDKKSYAIKLRDEKGESVDREFFGLRDDNNWILDAMAIDKACMRNRVSTDLWNDFATYPYHRREGWEKKARQGTRGEFVEVFLNGTYHGLYCMTE
ncbi:MAG: CotH kinase family protein, partial [Bacteroidaceae bacterium]|nr:CotH kinase family protein [Bacteroidaceae bacterium]